MSLIILTKSPSINLFTKVFWKSFLRLLFRRVRGPSSVTNSLLDGLAKLKVVFFLNYNYDFKENDVVFVNESISALKYAVLLKKTGKIKKLIAGPNFVINPNDEKAIMRSPEIDLLLLPCDWVKSYWVSVVPDLDNRCAVWPAGVRNRGGVSAIKRDTVLVYYKCCPSSLLKNIVGILQENKIKFEIIKYGHFKQSKYFKELNKSKVLIYLSNSESQGLAMFEAWERDVPTLVWNRGYAELSGAVFYGATSSPYLVPETGIFFENEIDFENKLLLFFNDANNFKPRECILKRFTNELCAQNFLNIIK